jgi:hypothetical protein
VILFRKVQLHVRIADLPSTDRLDVVRVADDSPSADRFWGCRGNGDLSLMVMIKRVALPLEGKTIRFAPGPELEPAAWFWRVWTERNEIYALTRNSGGVAKLSVHASGQIHYRLGPKHKQDLTPMMQFASSPWLHAFEIRFLMSEGAGAPPKQRESLKNKSAYVIPVPSGKFLVVNLNRRTGRHVVKHSPARSVLGGKCALASRTS